MAEEARRVAAEKRAVLQAQADAQAARHRNLQHWGAAGGGGQGPRPGPGPAPPLGMMGGPPPPGMMMMGGGAYMRPGMNAYQHHQMMMAMMAQRQAAEKQQLQRTREDLAARFKELLMDKGVRPSATPISVAATSGWQSYACNVIFHITSCPPCSLHSGDCLLTMGEGAPEAGG